MRLLLRCLRAAAFLATVSCATVASADGTLRLVSGSQLPLVDFRLGGRQLLTGALTVPPGQSIDLLIPEAGSRSVACSLGFRKGAFVDVVFRRLCGGSVIVADGKVTQYVVPRVRPEHVLRRVVFDGTDGDPAFSTGRALWGGKYRTVDGVEKKVTLVLGRQGDWTFVAEGGGAQGILSEISWPNMSTSFKFRLNDRWTSAIDRPYQRFFLSNGPPLRPVVEYLFKGYESGPETPWFGSLRPRPRPSSGFPIALAGLTLDLRGTARSGR